MKIQCDVCNKEEASLLCTADEAVLCHSYDHVVHHANNLASKHPRFSLLHPSSSKQYPLCDICQDIMGMTTDKRWSESDDVLTVPQFSPHFWEM
ncbi:hypothetical protein GOBAR_AA26902 [Gossypium barbadense]|uniref:B box-type domain-containing protein n=1 Tax=Gossypium barbadense TaxID=3634 RepID=A0A2P5WRQ4_GOSBA|nr:hypothetical protein GOBAR_AA26902 [Gossypium barbadense]